MSQDDAARLAEAHPGLVMRRKKPRMLEREDVLSILDELIDLVEEDASSMSGDQAVRRAMSYFAASFRAAFDKIAYGDPSTTEGEAE